MTIGEFIDVATTVLVAALYGGAMVGLWVHLKHKE